MKYRAILIAIFIACGMAGAVLLLATLLAVSVQSVPQTMLLFSLWILPGYFAGSSATEAGTLHGLLTGLLGMLTLIIGIEQLQEWQIMRLDPFGERTPLVFILLSGFWASVGGMLADTVRLIGVKRAARRTKQHSSGPN